MTTLRRLRINRGLTPEQLGEEVGVSGMTIRRIERGKAARPSTLKAIADHFEIDASDLLTVQENGERPAA